MTTVERDPRDDVGAPVRHDAGRASSGSEGEPARRVTLADLASLTNVSKSTASRALNRDPQISLRTQERIRRAAETLNYVPNNAARSLAMRSTQTFGLLIPDVSDPFNGQVASSFEQEAASHGYSVIFSSILAHPARERASLQLLASHRADGIAVMGSMEEPADVIAAVKPSPIVLVGTDNPRFADRFQGSLVGTIGADDGAGVAALVDHLVAQGHRRLAYVSGHHVASNVIRRQSVIESASRAGLRRPLLLSAGAAGWRAAADLAARVAHERPDAVVCYDDKLALALMDALTTHGISVPDDLSVVGFDDIPFAALARPRLTTVAQPAEEMGRVAVRMLVTAIRDRQMPASVVLPVHVVIRESTRARASG